MWNTHHPYFFWFFPLLVPLIALDVILKSVALWKSARNNQLYWFIALAIVNTAGILPAVYLIFFQPKPKKK